MVHFCAVPGCSNRSDRETHLSYHRLTLPLKNKVLKEWIHKIRTNLPSTRVCSEHFVRSTGRMLRVDEVPSEKLPVSRLATNLFVAAAATQSHRSILGT